MKFFETITSLLVLVNSAFSSPLSLNSSIMMKYNEFNDKYGREFSYDKFNNFKKNTEYIQRFNQEDHSFELEINQFADMNDFNFNISIIQITTIYF